MGQKPTKILRTESSLAADEWYRKGMKKRSRGELKASAELLRRALEIRQRKSPDTMTVADTCNNYGVVLSQLNDFKGAWKQLQRALEIRERKAPGSLAVANTYNNMGILLKSMGDLEGALEKHQLALSIEEQKVPNSMAIATTYKNIGLLLKEQGKLDDALESYNNALSIIESHGDPDSLTAAMTYNSIGLIRHDMGQVAEALKLYKCALVLKNESPYCLVVADTYNNIGLALQDQGSWDEALKHFKLALDIYKRMDPNSPGAGDIENNIGLLLKNSGELGQALLHCQHALMIYISMAHNLLAVADCHNNIGLILQEQGKLDGAKSHYQCALAIYQRKTPKNSSSVASVHNNLGCLLQEEGDLGGAMQHFRRAMEIKGKKYRISRKPKAPVSLAVANTYNNIALVQKKRGDLKAAIMYYDQCTAVLHGIEPPLPKTHPLLIICKHGLGAVYFDMDLFAETVRLTSEIIDDVPDYKWAYILKARALERQGDFEKAVHTYDQVIQKAPSYGDAHAGRVEAYLSLLSKNNEEEDKDTKLGLQSAYVKARGCDPAVQDHVDRVVLRLFLTEHLNSCRKFKEARILHCILRPEVHTRDDLSKIFERLEEKLDGRLRKELEDIRRQYDEGFSDRQEIKAGFLSHTGQDDTACRFTSHVKDEMEKMGLPFFYDVSSIPPGTFYEDYIEKSVVTCGAFVAILSPTYFKRYWCMRELDLALQHGRPVLPVYYSLSGPEDFPNNKDAFCSALLQTDNKKRIREGDLDRWWENIKHLKKIQLIRRTTEKDADLPVKKMVIKWLSQQLRGHIVLEKSNDAWWSSFCL